MSEPITHRWYEDRDLAPLTELLHLAYAPLGAAGMNFTAVDQSEKTTAYRVSLGHTWVFERGAELLGTLTISSPPSPVLSAMTSQAQVPGRVWLNQMAVHPSAQGEGLAHHMFTTALGWVRAEGFTSIGVDTAVSATHLIRLYERWGFQARDTIHWDGKTYDSTVLTLAF